MLFLPGYKNTWSINRVQLIPTLPGQTTTGRLPSVKSVVKFLSREYDVWHGRRRIYTYAFTFSFAYLSTHVVKCLNTPWSGGSDQPALLAGDSSAPPGDSSQAPSDGSASGDEKHTGNIVSAPPSFAAPPLDPALSSPLSTGLGANSRLGMFAPPATTLRAPGRGWWPPAPRPNAIFLEHPRRTNGPGTHVAHGGAGQASYCCCAEDREKKKTCVCGPAEIDVMARIWLWANQGKIQCRMRFRWATRTPTLGLSLSSHALGIVRVLLKAKFHTLYRPVTFLGALRVEHLSQTRKIRDHDEKREH